MKRLYLVSAMIVLSSNAAFAQETRRLSTEMSIQSWSASKGIYVLKLARESVSRSMASKIDSDPTISFGPKKKLSSAIASYGALDLNYSNRPGPRERTVTAVLPTKEDIELSYEAAYSVSNVFSFVFVSIVLDQLPTIHVVVEPAPPRDYRIVINGEDCPPTEESQYAAPAGAINVSVQRAGKKPCTWSGKLASGQAQQVKCSL